MASGHRHHAALKEEGIVKICALASSSSGNSIFVGTDRTRILIDAGLSRRETFLRLAKIGEDPEKLSAILITHEHSDHVGGLVRIAKKLNIPVFLTKLTAPAIDWDGFTPIVETFQAGASFTIGDVEISSFSIPHDAIDPVGYCLKANGVKAGIVTDLGYLPDSIGFHLRGTDFLLMESNHDLDMLKVGPYPWAVKHRVMSRRGHLSNDVVSTFIKETMDSSTATLMLGHLSEHNNHPAIVHLTASQALQSRGLATGLVVAEPGKQSEAFLF
ncbi:MAG: MBL fold metallo-hydrolase [Candidatus Solibacter usitatus]|nr:MBL fold metallo-hydrolase [Candidatus Solibacter usitatus]